MTWVSREPPKDRSDRVPLRWIRKFIDHESEIVYVPANQVLDCAKADGAQSFDAPGAK